MLERYVICDNSLKKCYENKQMVGYKVKVGIPYYRSVPLSCIEQISLLLDNEEVDSEQLVLELGGSVYTLAELSDRMDTWWGFMEKGYLIVRNGAGLPEGKHKVKVQFTIRIPYLIPTNGQFLVNYDVTNAVKFMEVNV